MTNELPYQRSDEFDQELYLRPIDDDGRRFLRLMFQAANGTVEGCKGGIVQRTRFWLMAEQTVLADLLGISREIKQDSRTKRVRRIVEGLEELGILRRATMVDKAEDGKPIERLYYVLCLMRLMDLPQIDLNTVEGRVVAHLLHNDPFADQDDDSSTDKEPMSVGLSGRLSGALSGGLSGPSKTPAPVPDLVSINKTLPPDPVPDQEQDSGSKEDFESIFGQEKIPVRSFAEINPDEVRWIAGFSPQGKTPTVEIRRRLFLGYLRDACTKGFATTADAALLLQVFSLCGHKMSEGGSTGQRVRDPTGWIRAVWMNRLQKPPKLRPGDKKLVAELLPRTVSTANV